MPTIHIKLEVKKKTYFCPICKIVFSDIEQDSKIIHTKECEKFDYQCKSCKKCFNQDTYEKTKSNGMNYSYIKHSKKLPIEVIQEHVLKLWKESVSQKDIQEITHFSRELIDKVLHSYFNKSEDYTINNFKTNYLKSSGILGSDIVNAIKKGCSHRITAKLFKVGNKTIQKALLNEELKQNNGITIDRSVKITMKKDIITVKSHEPINFLSLLPTPEEDARIIR